MPLVLDPPSVWFPQKLVKIAVLRQFFALKPLQVDRPSFFRYWFPSEAPERRSGHLLFDIGFPLTPPKGGQAIFFSILVSL